MPPVAPKVEYGEATYWDERYTRDQEPFDWYQSYKGLKKVLNQHIAKEGRVMMSGCGNSNLSAEMVEDGYTSICNVDISSVVIKDMLAKYRDVREMTFMVGDVMTMPEHADATFDSIVDKGTLDAIMCGNHGADNAARLLAESTRVLKQGGVFMLITYGDPGSRLPLIERPEFGLKVQIYLIAKGQQGGGVGEGGATTGPFHPSNPAERAHVMAPSSVHYVYVCTKT